MNMKTGCNYGTTRGVSESNGLGQANYAGNVTLNMRTLIILHMYSNFHRSSSHHHGVGERDLLFVATHLCFLHMFGCHPLCWLLAHAQFVNNCVRWVGVIFLEETHKSTRILKLTCVLSNLLRILCVCSFLHMCFNRISCFYAAHFEWKPQPKYSIIR